ncbi:MAG: PAS domain S-box protein, partial [Pseudomonadota bacterium]
LALELGADRFIRKPLDGPQFMAALKGVVREVAKGELALSETNMKNEEAFLKVYNERLIQKLEKKMEDLEQETIARRQSEHLLKATLAAVPDMIFLLNRVGRFLDFKSAKTFDPYLTPDQFLGKTAVEVLPAELARKTMECIAQALDENTTVALEYQLPYGEELRHYEARYAPCGEDLVVAVVRDITSERQTLKTLTESEDRYRALVESSADHIFMLNPEGVYLASNHRCVQKKLENGESLVGRNVREFHAPDVARDYLERIPQVVSTGQSLSFEHEMQSPDGPHWHLDTLYPLVRDGQVWAVGGICRDITDRKVAEDTLRASEKKYRDLFESSIDAISIVTVDGRTVDANQAFFDLFGYSREKIIDQKISGLYVNPDDRRIFLEALKRNGFVRDLESLRRKKDGSRIACLVTAVAQRDKNGDITSIQCITRDVTAVRDLETQYRQSQKMEAVGRLAGGVAHDFNNMLSIIIGYADIALDKLSPSDPLFNDLKEIETAGRRSAELVRQLLAFARKQTIAPRVLDLNALISQSEKMMRRLIGEDIELKFVPAAELWKVKLDPTQLDQTLANLAVNSRDAVSGVGAITIETANVVFDQAYCDLHAGFVPGKYALLTFSDSGSSMDKETLEKIFDPFFTTKGEGKGTGLGLSTVYGIVKQNHGFINVYSEPGQGTAFKIYLPRIEGEPEAVAAPVDDRLLTGTETILVVEDEEQILRLCRKVLESKGYKVIAAERPGEAIVLCEKHPGEIDLLITDVVMPTMNGRELKERIAALKPGIRVLYMSGYTADVIAYRGVLSEGTHFIQKPFSTNALARKVRDVLDATHARQSA